MPEVTKARRLELLRGAIDTAGIALARIEELSNSGNPDVAARATALLIVERNEQDDLKVLKAILEHKPAALLKPISEDTVAMLVTLEEAIDARIRNNRLINASLASATEILRMAEAIGQITGETA